MIRERKKRISQIGMKKKKTGNKRRGVSDYWLYVRKRGRGHSDMRTVCNRGVGGGGGLKVGKNAYVISGSTLILTCNSSIIFVIIL